MVPRPQGDALGYGIPPLQGSVFLSHAIVLGAKHGHVAQTPHECLELNLHPAQGATLCTHLLDAGTEPV